MTGLKLTKIEIQYGQYLQVSTLDNMEKFNYILSHRYLAEPFAHKVGFRHPRKPTCFRSGGGGFAILAIARRRRHFAVSRRTAVPSSHFQKKLFMV